MLIALYQDHNELPFWNSPQQAKEVFDPSRHGLLGIATRDETLPLQQTRIWSVLMGLHTINLPVMAHVSLYCECQGEGKRHFPKRIWVQITTLPEKKNNQGIPVTMEDNKVVVKHLWGGDNGTYGPYQFLSSELHDSNQSSEFWREFFLKGLDAVRKNAVQNVVSAQAELTATQEWAANISAIIA